MIRNMTGSLLLIALLAGCNNEPRQRLNAPPHGEAEKTTDNQGTFVYMADNAMLADMSVHDAHFLPHRAQLNSVGVERVSRLASLMQAYGGTIRLSSNIDDETLLNSRTQTIREFLQEAGVVTSTETIRRDMPGGAGMDATEAIMIRANEGAYKPKSGDSKGQSPSGSASGTSTK